MVSLQSDLIAAELSSLSLQLDLFAFFCKCSPNRHFPLLQEKQQLTAKFNRMDRLPNFITSINHNLIVIWTLLQNAFANSWSCKLYAFIFCVMVKRIKLPDLIWLMSHDSSWLLSLSLLPGNIFLTIKMASHFPKEGILSDSKLHLGHDFLDPPLCLWR